MTTRWTNRPASRHGSAFLPKLGSRPHFAELAAQDVDPIQLLLRRRALPHDERAVEEVGVLADSLSPVIAPPSLVATTFFFTSSRRPETPRSRAPSSSPCGSARVRASSCAATGWRRASPLRRAPRGCARRSRRRSGHARRQARGAHLREEARSACAGRLREKRRAMMAEERLGSKHGERLAAPAAAPLRPAAGIVSDWMLGPRVP